MSDENLKTTETLKVIKKQKRDRKHLINIILILTITFFYTFFSLRSDLPDVIKIFQSQDTDYRMAIIVLILVLMRYLIEGLILFIFARLYTPTYRYHRGVANAFVGQFYNDVTPSGSGGQFAQVKTFSQQGVPVSVSASILVMHFILFQIVLVTFGAFAILLNISVFTSLAPIPIFNINFPIWVLALLGFLLNLIVIVGLFLLSYWKKAHSFFIDRSIDFLAKLRIIKNPDKRKEKLHISTENFRIELRRLSSNIPVSILIMGLFVLKLFINYSITYTVALMLEPTLVESVSYLATVSKSSFLAMITGLIPIPGAAGFAEYFFEVIFTPEFGGNVALTKAVQIIWRSATFYFSLIVGGLVTAFYRSSMEEIIDEQGHVKTFDQVKTETFAERRATSITMYETSQLSIKEIQRRLTPKKKREKPEDEDK